jgi:hypothetical protein
MSADLRTGTTETGSRPVEYTLDTAGPDAGFRVAHPSQTRRGRGREQFAAAMIMPIDRHGRVCTPSAWLLARRRRAVALSSTLLVGPRHARGCWGGR